MWVRVLDWLCFKEICWKIDKALSKGHDYFDIQVELEHKYFPRGMTHFQERLDAHYAKGGWDINMQLDYTNCTHTIRMTPLEALEALEALEYPVIPVPPEVLYFPLTP